MTSSPLSPLWHYSEDQTYKKYTLHRWAKIFFQLGIIISIVGTVLAAAKSLLGIIFAIAGLTLLWLLIAVGSFGLFIERARNAASGKTIISKGNLRALMTNDRDLEIWLEK